MPNAKIVSMSARPLQASHLCFETGGILGQLNTQLGAQVLAFDFTNYYSNLLETNAGGDLLVFNSSTIWSTVAPAALAALRAEARKPALDNAIRARQNAYFAKYGSVSDIIFAMNQNYAPITGAKPGNLSMLSILADQQATALQAAYGTTGRGGVVQSTRSQLSSTTQSVGTSTGQSDEDSIQAPGTWANFELPAGGAQSVIYGQGPLTATEQISTSGEQSSGFANEQQTILNFDYGFRMPSIESQAQNLRAQISLADEQFAVLLKNPPSLYAPSNLAQFFNNELNSMDGQVYRLQIAYLNTILFSPIAGTVTGIYKNPGDAVAAGEPVIRVENNAVILLVATLIFTGIIEIGDTVTVTTKLFDTARTVTVTGRVVAARGKRADDEWEMIVQCNNLDGSGFPIFPLGYHFDYDNTTVVT
jgi:HlyD family secretion protein